MTFDLNKYNTGLMHKLNKSVMAMLSRNKLVGCNLNILFFSIIMMMDKLPKMPNNMIRNITKVQIGSSVFLFLWIIIKVSYQQFQLQFPREVHGNNNLFFGCQEVNNILNQQRPLTHSSSIMILMQIVKFKNHSRMSQGFMTQYLI